MTELGIDQGVAEHKEHNGKVEVFNANLHKELFDRTRRRRVLVDQVAARNPDRRLLVRTRAKRRRAGTALVALLRRVSAMRSRLRRRRAGAAQL